MKIGTSLLKKIQAFFREGGWLLIVVMIFVGVELDRAWREHRTIAIGFTHRQDNFGFIVGVGDYFLYFLFYALILVAIRAMSSSLSKKRLINLARGAFLLFVIWQVCRRYLLTLSGM